MKYLFQSILSMILLLNLTVQCGRAVRADVFPHEALPAMHAHARHRWEGKISRARPITWSPVEVECPICKTKNTFLQWGSYGSYIYQFPSKYQLVFWPYTDSAAWYSCKKCRLTTFMEDFNKLPAEKIPALRQLLEGVSLPPQKERSVEQSQASPPYLEIPTSARLVVAEKVYRALGKTDDEFWNHFYRVMGYHFGQDKKRSEADEARRQSLALTERFLADKAREGRRKELLYISGAMKHFLREDDAALREFEEAKKLVYSDKDNKPEENKGYDQYLSALIDEYIDMLHKGKGPQDEDTDHGH
jgi:hypothetical protein